MILSVIFNKFISTYIVFIGHVSVMDRPMSVADEGHVVVKVKAVGVCATDIHGITGKVQLATPPCVPGHEIAGEIEEVGSAVKKLFFCHLHPIPFKII